MDSTNQKDNTPYFFLVTEQYVLGTPRGMATSDKTIDIPFQNLAENYDLQIKLNLGSAVFIKPVVLPPLAYPMQGSELHNAVAVFLSAFADDPTEQQQRKNYLVNNGLVRILVTDDTLREEVRKVA